MMQKAAGSVWSTGAFKCRNLKHWFVLRRGSSASDTASEGGITGHYGSMLPMSVLKLDTEAQLCSPALKINVPSQN